MVLNYLPVNFEISLILWQNSGVLQLLSAPAVHLFRCVVVLTASSINNMLLRRTADIYIGAKIEFLDFVSSVVSFTFL